LANFYNMKTTTILYFFLIGSLLLTSCVSKSKYDLLQADLDVANGDLAQNNTDLKDQSNKLNVCVQEKENLGIELSTTRNTLELRAEQIQDLKDQIADLRRSRDMQAEQVGDLTVLSQSASDNIRETLDQLQKRDQYIHLLQAAKTKADSINLALAVNLKNVLEDGINDRDVEVRVDKTVVYINLSDKMLYRSGSAEITPTANEILGKIAQIVESRPNLEVMVEGHTDNLPISRAGIRDNWDLSVLRATSVVRVLQNDFNVDASRLIASGRGEYRPLVTNDTSDGRSVNRRTRILILPQLDQFYDLLNPNNVPN
jgi:chemotaxis protein MotB